MSESVKKALNKPELTAEYIKKYPEFKYGRIYKK